MAIMYIIDGEEVLGLPNSCGVAQFCAEVGRHNPPMIHHQRARWQIWVSSLRCWILSGCSTRGAAMERHYQPTTTTSYST